MPTYSYRCTACDHAFDIQQAFSDESLTECPSCGGALRKVFSPVGVTFSGSGFYRTDSRAEKAKGKKAGSAAEKSGGGSDSGSSSGSGSGSSGGSDSGSTASKSSGAGAGTTGSSGGSGSKGNSGSKSGLSSKPSAVAS